LLINTITLASRFVLSSKVCLAIIFKFCGLWARSILRLIDNLLLFLDLGFLLGFEFFFSLSLFLPPFLGGASGSLVQIFFLIVGVFSATSLAALICDRVRAPLCLDNLAS
jgi:hypothetical protein